MGRNDERARVMYQGSGVVYGSEGTAQPLVNMQTTQMAREAGSVGFMENQTSEEHSLTQYTRDPVT